MMNYYWGNLGSYNFSNMMGLAAPFAPFMLLDIVLKGFALYKSARKGQTYWFIALLVVNSLGILPGIYLLMNRKQPTKVSAPKSKSKKR